VSGRTIANSSPPKRATTSPDQRNGCHPCAVVLIRQHVERANADQRHPARQSKAFGRAHANPQSAPAAWTQRHCHGADLIAAAPNMSQQQA